MNAKGFWDHKDEALLIDMVRQYPSIWHTLDKDYPKKGLKRLRYMQIAEELKKIWPDRAHLLTAVSLKRKFNTLRTYFQREQKKMKIWDKTNTEKMFPKWIHFNKMLFLTEDSGRNESESEMNISIVSVEGGIRNCDKETEHNDSVAETSSSDSTKEKDPSSSLQPFIQLNKEAVALSLKKEILDDSSPMSVSFVTKSPVKASVAETSCSSDGSVETDSTFSLQSSVQSTERDGELSVKIEPLGDSSPVSASFRTETPVNDVVEASISDINEGMDSTLSIQLNEIDAEALKRKPSNPSPVSDLVETETSEILKAGSASVQVPTSFTLGSENSVVSSLNQVSIGKADEPMKTMQTNEEADETSLKKNEQNDSSPVCDSINTKTQENFIADETSSDRSERTDSSLPFQPTVALNKEADELPLKRKKQSNSSPVCDSTKTPVKAAVARTSCSNSNEGTVSFLQIQPTVQSNKEVSELPLKRKKQINSSLFLFKRNKVGNSSPMCDSTQTETPVILKALTASAQRPSAFNVALGNLVVASINQMPPERANAATKEIFDILLKYGGETNHLR